FRQIYLQIQVFVGKVMLESEPLSSSDEPVFDSFWRSIEIRFILKNVIYSFADTLVFCDRLNINSF
ncbi:hypothetical protein, partial [Leptospira borgpetersenii]|uniref:hypothetical protein n=1 Tax=Leptospira borgpetersenii TaxID=174 RepID=UPI0027DD4CDC